MPIWRLAAMRASSGSWRRSVARNPLRERLRTQLMLARYRSGRQAEALAGYRELRELLATELGIEPSAALRDLERRVLQQDPTLDLAPAERPHRRAVGHRGIRPGAARSSRRHLSAPMS